uniref:Multiple epidermal growth factor-like domains 10 n=1 Tax=Magallana gigas TaxID=29159 RepID=A0A8W8NIG6_MAGGI
MASFASRKNVQKVIFPGAITDDQMCYKKIRKYDISHNKIATQSHTYNDLFYKHGASNAIDRNAATCTRTYPIGGNTPVETVWWKVDLGGVSSIYSINIQFKSYDGYVDRQKGRLAGFSLYVSNSDVNSPDDIKKTTLCYKDEPKLPPLNLTKKCMEYGRYVIFYNERLNGIAYQEEYEVANVFTELCEVIVQGCSNASIYGINCDTPCPTNCKDSTCHIENGACSLCKPGLTGLDCKLKCREGWYGMNCTKLCVGHCRDDAACNHVTGFCDRGCAAGWKGDLCGEGFRIQDFAVVLHSYTILSTSV